MCTYSHNCFASEFVRLLSNAVTVWSVVANWPFGHCYLHTVCLDHFRLRSLFVHIIYWWVRAGSGLMRLCPYHYLLMFLRPDPFARDAFYNYLNGVCYFSRDLYQGGTAKFRSWFDFSIALLNWGKWLAMPGIIVLWGLVLTSWVMVVISSRFMGMRFSYCTLEDIGFALSDK
jgi:hypothetical protein